jgi:hypothetical protein
MRGFGYGGRRHTSRKTHSAAKRYILAAKSAYFAYVEGSASFTWLVAAYNVAFHNTSYYMMSMLRERSQSETVRWNVIYLWKPMKATRFLTVALAACLVTVWTCPAYCSSMSAHSAKAPSAVEMTGHEHHHMSDMSVPLDGPALMAIHRDCCDRCGGADQAIGAGQTRASALKSNSIWASLITPSANEAFALGFASPPLLKDTSPPTRSASPLRI